MKEFLYKTYDMILERLRYAEAKNTIIITLLGVLVIGAFRIYDETPDRPLIVTIYFWTFLLFAIIAIITALTSFMPNIKLQYLYKPKNPLSSDSRIYYEHIAKFNDAQSYIDAVNQSYFNSEAVPGELEYDLGAQIILNSRSTYRKSVLSYYAIVFCICAILTPIAGGIYLIFSRYFYWTTENGKTTLKFGRKKTSKEEIKEIRNTRGYDFSRYFRPILPKKRIRKMVLRKTAVSAPDAEDEKTDSQDSQKSQK